MGIPGLTAFINKEFRGWKRQVLKGYLVIDGSSLCHCLYTFQWNNGGEYPQYRTVVLDMFKALLEVQIHPIVVFDGIYIDQGKIDTTLKRRRESIKYVSENLASSKFTRNVLPLLTKEVFQLLLKEINVPFYVVDGEADNVIVEVANYYGCPVLGSDSDYFLFNIEGGYIPIERFDWKTRPVSCEVFYMLSFLEEFAIKHEDLRYIVPAIIGNDCLARVYTDRLINRLVIDRNSVPSGQPVARVMMCLSQYSSVEELIQHVHGVPNAYELELNYHKAHETYNCTKQTDPESLLTSCVLKTAQGEAIPNWIVSRYRQGDFSRLSMNALVLTEAILKICPDAPGKASSFYASLLIRQKLYYLLCIPAVVEFTRKGSGISPIKVDSRPVLAVSPQLPIPYPLEVLYEVLDCKLSLLEEVEDNWKLVAMAARYWSASIPPHTQLVEALIYCHVVCYTQNAHLNRLRRKCSSSCDFKRSHKRKVALHAFAQWQCCYLDALSVNQLLLDPLKCISPALLYDGTIALFIAENVSAAPSTFPVDSRLYDMIHRAVLLDSSLVAHRTEGHTKSKISAPVIVHGEKSREFKVVSSKASLKFAHSNPFSILQTSESDSD